MNTGLSHQLSDLLNNHTYIVENGRLALRNLERGAALVLEVA
mgnify:CR=1 FL=1